MKSDGGMCPVDNFTGFVSILSGPAGPFFSFISSHMGESKYFCLDLLA